METLDLLRAGRLAGTQKLSLACGLTEFPPEILDLADSLEILDLANNQLAALPDEFGQLQKLKIVFLSKNNFESIPEVLSQCPNLKMVGFKSSHVRFVGENALPSSVRWLILTDNQIEVLPRSIGKLKNLQKVMLAGNKLRSLPDEMAACRNLELIRLSANNLPSLPEWLFSLPRLSWLAFAGNPCFERAPEFSASPPEIDWADLEFGNSLGQGASGVISKATWQKSLTQTEAVAVKIFKGEVTSDGFPADEMRACLAAGEHDNLVAVLGKLINAPDDRAGLVFSLIPPHYTNLGGPPDLETCTRDTYRSEQIFSLSVILRIARGIAAAIAHLHGRGITHGDLYAHNILMSKRGDSLLGDFGAASFYDPTDAVLGRALESLEARAFGCLLEELLDRCHATDRAAQAEAIDALRRLQQDCLQPTPSLRPSFVQIVERLAQVEQPPTPF